MGRFDGAKGSSRYEIHSAETIDANEVRRSRGGPMTRMQLDLDVFERRYNVTSAIMLNRVRAGDTRGIPVEIAEAWAKLYVRYRELAGWKGWKRREPPAPIAVNPDAVERAKQQARDMLDAEGQAP